MNRREFAFALPAALVTTRIGWSMPANGNVSSDKLLHLAFRSGTGEAQCGNECQIQLRETVAALTGLGYAVHSNEWGTDYQPVKGRLTGSCRLAIRHFPPAFAPIVANWLRPGLERSVYIALDGFHIAVRTPADALRIANPTNPERLRAI